MRHFICFSSGSYCNYVHLDNSINYYCNNEFNKIIDFSCYCCNNTDGYWAKTRAYRGGYVYHSKKPHYETSHGIKMWNYGKNTYYSYEEYMLAVMGFSSNIVK